MPRLLVLAALLAASSPALAQPAFGPPGTVMPEVPDAPAPTHTERYGWQIFLADAGWLAATVAIDKVSPPDGSGPQGLLGLGYFATGPLVHLAHGNRSGAAKSLAARALIPLGGALVGMALASQQSNSDGFAVLGGMVLGGGAGMISAMALDWLVLGKHEVADRPRGYAVAPTLAFSHTSATFSLAGQF